MIDFNWQTKQKVGGRRSSDFDVSLSLSKQKGVDAVAAFIFRDDCFKKVSKTGYVVFAFVNNRIYFKEADQRTGYHFSPRANGTSATFQTMNKMAVDNAKYMSGDYNLKYDKEYDMYYIECFDFTRKDRK